MNTGAIAGVVIGVIVVVALVTLAVRLARRRELQRRRELAGQQWQEAEVRTARAERREAEVAERQAGAAREQAMAREQAAHADADRRAAEERHATASRLDPDPHGHTAGQPPRARSGAVSTQEITDEPDEADRPQGLGRLTRFGRRKTAVAAAESGPWRRPGYAPPPKNPADAAGPDGGGDLP